MNFAAVGGASLRSGYALPARHPANGKPLRQPAEAPLIKGETLSKQTRPALSYAIQMAAMSIVQGGFLYFVIYEVGGSLTIFSHMALVLAAASLLSQPAWVRASRMLGKLPTYRLSIAALAVGEFLLVFPRHGDNGLTYAVAVVIGASSSGFSMMALSMMIDAIVDSSEQSGFNRQGVFSGIWSATEKASFAGGSLIVGLIYQLVGFQASKAGFVEQTPLAHAGIRYVCGLVTPALLLLSLWSLSRLKSPPRPRAGNTIIPAEAATPRVML